MRATKWLDFFIMRLCHRFKPRSPSSRTKATRAWGPEYWKKQSGCWEGMGRDTEGFWAKLMRCTFEVGMLTSRLLQSHRDVGSSPPPAREQVVSPPSPAAIASRTPTSECAYEPPPCRGTSRRTFQEQGVWWRQTPQTGHVAIDTGGRAQRGCSQCRTSSSPQSCIQGGRSGRISFAIRVPCVSNLCI